MTPDRPGDIGFTVTARDIWEKLDRIEGSISHVPAAVLELSRRIEDHELRLRGMERKVYAISGLASVVGVGGGALVSSILR